MVVERMIPSRASRGVAIVVIGLWITLVWLSNTDIVSGGRATPAPIWRADCDGLQSYADWLAPTIYDSDAFRLVDELMGEVSSPAGLSRDESAAIGAELRELVAELESVEPPVPVKNFHIATIQPIRISASIFETWAERDTVGVMALANELDAAEERHEAEKRSVSEQCGLDFDAMLDTAEARIRGTPVATPHLD